MSVIRYNSEEATVARYPSPSIWGDCHPELFLSDPSKGSHLFEDFKGGVEGGTALVTGQRNDMTCFLESADIADALVQADQDGIVLLQSDGSDADVYAIVGGANLAGAFRMPKIGESKKFWFEARVAVNHITADGNSLFVGMVQPGEAKDAGGGFTAGGAALSDIDYVGFAKLSGDTTELEIVYNEAGAGVAQSTSGQIVLAADTYVRLGMKVEVKGNKVTYRFYVDGVDQGDSVAIDLDGGANANWPGDTDMDFMFSIVAESGTGDGEGAFIDWIRVAQEN